MKPIHRYLILFLVAAILLLALSLYHKTPAGSGGAPPNAPGNPAANAQSPAVAATSSTQAASPAALGTGPNATTSGPVPSQQNLASQAGQLIIDTNAPAGLPPETVLRNVSHAIHQYGDQFGGNPVGLNSEITAALAGQNPKHINFIDPAAGMSINSKGELVDPWGTPYFFHQLSGTDMEIHSAGPDKIMWTSDDLVTH